MSIPDVAVLRFEFELMPHQKRVRRLVGLARQYRSTPTLTTLLDDLTNLSVYHARLVLAAAKAVGDTDRLRSLATHANPTVRIPATLALPFDDDPEKFTRRYLDAPLALRKAILRRVEGRRPDLIGALIKAPLADADRAVLLAYAEPATAAAYLADLGDLISNLSAFAKRHPDVLFAELEARLQGPPAKLDQTWAWIAPALAKLVDANPRRLLRLLIEAGPSEGIPSALDRHLGRVAKANPTDFARLLAKASRSPTRPSQSWRQPTPTPRFPKSLRRQLGALPAADRNLLAGRYRDDEHSLAALLDAIAPAQRAETFRAAFAEVNLTNRTFSRSLLEVLPRQLREAEAARIVGLAENSAVANQLAWAPFLAPEQAKAIAEPRLRAASAVERASAWTALLNSAARSRDREVLAQALSRLPRLANEQDPVRLAVASTLVATSPALLAQVTLEPLLQFSTALIQARDTSGATLRQLQRVAWSLLIQAAGDDRDLTAVLGMLDSLCGPDGVTTVPRPLAVATKAIPKIVATFLPRLRSQTGRDDYRLTFSLWNSLGRRAWDVPELVALIESATMAPADHLRRESAPYWLADPRTRADRVGRLLAADESFAVLSPVQSAICTRRQDLVGVFYRHKPLSGRLWSRKALFVPLLSGPFTGWLPEQLTNYAAAVNRLIKTEHTGSHVQVRGVSILGRLPDIGADQVQPYLDQSNISLVEAALATLAWTDDPGRQLPTLLAHRGDDQARVAMYAAGRCLKRVPPYAATKLLIEVLTDPNAKVTARKEAVRLLGTLRVPESLPVLVAQVRPNIHPDVRLAAARSLRSFLDDERAWVGLESLSDAGRDAAMSLAQTRPAQLPRRHRRRFAELLRTTAAGGDPEVVRALGSWGPWLPGIAVAVAELVASSDLPISRAAVAASGQIAAAATDWQPFLETVASLALAGASADEPNAEDAADLPSRRRIECLVSTLCPQHPAAASWHHEHLEQLGDELARYRELADVTWQVRLAAIDWRDPSEGLIRLADHADPLRTRELMELVRTSLRAARDQTVTPDLAQAADLLASRTGAPAAGIALALVTDAGVEADWPPPWRARLRALRQHPIGAVAAWAAQIQTVSS
jgi:hypothetical protein